MVKSKQPIFVIVCDVSSYESGSAVNILVADTDAIRCYKRFLGETVNKLQNYVDLLEVEYLFREYKVIEIPDVRKLTSAYILNKIDSAKTVSQVLALDEGLHQDVKNTCQNGYYIENDEVKRTICKNAITYLRSLISGEGENDKEEKQETENIQL